MMNERNVMLTGLFSFAAGLVVGGAAGVLLTPQSGPRTRRQLMHLAEDMKERAGELADETSEAMHRMVERGRSLATG